MKSSRKSRKSRVKNNLISNPRVKLNISLVKTLTVVADKPIVYVRVTPPCSGQHSSEQVSVRTDLH